MNTKQIEDYVINAINVIESETPEYLMSCIYEDIRNHEFSFEDFFPEINWDNVDKEYLYERIVNRLFLNKNLESEDLTHSKKR